MVHKASNFTCNPFKYSQKQNIKNQLLSIVNVNPRYPVFISNWSRSLLRNYCRPLQKSRQPGRCLCTLINENTSAIKNKLYIYEVMVDFSMGRYGFLNTLALWRFISVRDFATDMSKRGFIAIVNERPHGWRRIRSFVMFVCLCVLRLIQWLMFLTSS